MKITINYTIVTNFHHNLIPNIVVRVGRKGIVVRGWVSQREVLAQIGVGSFMTHCLWNFVMEALSNRLPLVTSPIQLDRSHNARLVVYELKVGIEV